LVINIWSIHDARSEKISVTLYPNYKYFFAKSVYPTENIQ